MGKRGVVVRLLEAGKVEATTVISRTEQQVWIVKSFVEKGVGDEVLKVEPRWWVG